MTKLYKKKLIEVAIPLEAINAASVHEKMPGIGPHPRGLHLWWARRPLAACRAVLFAQLVDDPSSLPDQFPTAKLQDAERKRLFAIIEDLVKWENSTNEEVLERARAEIRRSCGGILPPIHDPFSGGGSIPLEAQRLGLPAYGSDLNPVAVMIGKAMIEIPHEFKDREPIHPGVKTRIYYRNAEGLAEDVKYYGEWMRKKAQERIGHLYPKVDLPKEYGGGKATVVAWIWSRTVPSPDPAFSDVHVPIASNFVLSTKSKKETWVEPIIDKQNKTIGFRVKRGGSKEEYSRAKEGTKSGRANFRCLLSGDAITSEYIKAKGLRGEIGYTLMAIVADSKNGRIYLSPDDLHSHALNKDELKNKSNELRETFLSGEVPAKLTGGTCHGYGLDQWGKIFTDRQVLSLSTFVEILKEARSTIENDAIIKFKDDVGYVSKFDAHSYAEAVSVYLSFAIDRCADFNNSIVRWSPSNEKVMNLFARQSIPMTWDFAEANIMEMVVGGFQSSTDFISKCICTIIPFSAGIISFNDAQTVKFPEGAVISSDPPYYDNIGYADLSDFFFVWMKQSLKEIYPEIFGMISTPKSEELVAIAHRHGGREGAESYFLNGMRTAIKNISTHSSEHYPTTIYYAFKQSEIEAEGISSTGWSTFLQAVIDSGYSVVGTWPIRSEQAYRMIATGTNALANSVVLVCRKKDASAETITRAEFIRTLKRELPSAIKELQAANIAPADMPQSAIGPGMGVFSRYRAVLESDDSQMSVKAALQLINRELDEYLGGIQGEFDADTRFTITWFEQNGMKAGDYGTAASIAQARGISVDSVKHAGIVESQAGKVRVLRRDELDNKWDPGTDQHLTIWECLQHLVRLHEKDGISHATAVLLKKIGDKAEPVKDLAYILYDISANKRQDAKEATAYNALIADWTELSRQAASNLDTVGDRQQRLDL